jgi:signal transduction histidine kinase
MKDSPALSLPASLAAYPGAVLRLEGDGHVVASNGRLEVRLAAELLGTGLTAALDDASRDKLKRVLKSDSTGLLEVLFVGQGMLHTLRFSVWRDEVEPERVWLLEVPTDQAGERLQDELTLGNAELVVAQRELTKKSGRLGRALDEIERKLSENEDLSRVLQAQNEEMEAQNEELLAMTEELYQGREELLHLNNQLQRRTLELQTALGARSRFYAAMSHELRTPINAVMGYNDLLLAGVYGPLREQQETAVERAQRAARQLRELIDDVLDISKLEAGKFGIELETVGLRSLLEDMVDLVEPLAEGQGTELNLVMDEGAPELVRTDPRRVRQILLNLLSNALKYGRGNPVFVRAGRSADGGVVVEVVDSGSGISAPDLASVFDEFVQLSPGRAEGTGLGLPISRRLATLLGGSLDLSSTPGVGSTFRLTLPLQPPPPVEDGEGAR